MLTRMFDKYISPPKPEDKEIFSYELDRQTLHAVTSRNNDITFWYNTIPSTTFAAQECKLHPIYNFREPLHSEFHHGLYEKNSIIHTHYIREDKKPLQLDNLECLLERLEATQDFPANKTQMKQLLHNYGLFSQKTSSYPMYTRNCMNDNLYIFPVSLFHNITNLFADICESTYFPAMGLTSVQAKILGECSKITLSLFFSDSPFPFILYFLSGHVLGSFLQKMFGLQEERTRFYTTCLSSLCLLGSEDFCAFLYAAQVSMMLLGMMIIFDQIRSIKNQDIPSENLELPSQNDNDTLSL